METPDLSSDTFWKSRGIHVALPTANAPLPAGLIPMAEPHLPEGGCLFLTSGTTGSPKWVALEKRAFLHSARVINARFDLTARDHWLVALPEHHVGGFSIHARAWLAGASVSRHRHDRWDPTELVKKLNALAITVTSLVPTQLHDLVACQLACPASLRLVFVGGGRLDPGLHEAAQHLGWPVCATYGMTETASQVATQASDAMHLGPQAPLEVLPHWDVESHADTDCLIVRGPALARGYLTPGSSPSEPFSWTAIPDSELITSDRVRLHRDGLSTHITVLGRLDHVVKISGELVSLEAVEKDWSPWAGTECPVWCVVALPDPRREHQLVLVVESEANPVLRERLRQQLTDYNLGCPRLHSLTDIRFWPSLPRTNLGKLARHALTAALAASEPALATPSGWQ